MTTHRTLMTFAAALLLVGPLAGCNRRGDGDRDIDVMMGDAGALGGGSHEILGGTEYGSGEYAIILTGETAPRRYCWYVGETVQVCPTGMDRETLGECIDDETSCLAHQPPDEEHDATCWTNTDWDTVSGEALYGDCAHQAAYWGDDPSVECLYHRHCNTNELCVDYLCVCPEGTECGADPGPAPGPGASDAGAADPGPGPGPGPGPSTPDAGPPSGGPGTPPAPPAPAP